MSRAPTYDWRCRRCESVNLAHTTVCANCKFDTEYHSPTLWVTMANEGVPAWKRLVCYAFGGLGALLFIVGSALFMKVYFLTNLTGMAWSAAATAVGALLLWTTYKLYPRGF